MKILIVYYSRTHTTQKVAETMHMLLGGQADIEELVDLTSRIGGPGYLRGGRDVIFKRQTRIEPAQHNPQEYDLIIIGTPVWVGSMSLAINEYLKQFPRYLKQVAFFTTQGDPQRQRVFDDLRRATRKEPVAELMLTTDEVVQNRYREKLDDFVKKINQIAKGPSKRVAVK